MGLGLDRRELDSKDLVAELIGKGTHVSSLVDSKPNAASWLLNKQRSMSEE